MRILAKVGGATIETEPGRAELAAAVAQARAGGHELLLVHGGGNQIRALTRRLGLEERYHEGLRVTDAETADVVVMVLAGLVNKQVVHALEAAGVPACGLSGVDGSTVLATPLHAPGVELGYVGEVDAAKPGLVGTLLAHGFVPVVATVAGLGPRAAGRRDHFYNLNADLCAGPLAAAFAADAMLFLTDVPGVLDEAKRRLEKLTPRDCGRLRESGVIAGGMIPKVDAALHALRLRPQALVKIAPAAGRTAIVAALSESVGTTFVT